MLTTWTRPIRATIAVLLVAAFAVGCAGGDTDVSTSGGDEVDIPASKFVDETSEDQVAVAVADNTFEAPYVEVSEGTKILWSNVGRNQHNVQPSEPDAFEGVATNDFAPGQSYSVTFDQSGDYPYFCSIHGTKKGSGQSGVIRVVPAEGS